MLDPEVPYRAIASGRPGTVRAAADTLRDMRALLTDARGEIEAAALVPIWSGTAAQGFAARLQGIAMGVAAHESAAAQVAVALEAAASAYDDALADADGHIATWRNRPAGMPAVVETVLALVVTTSIVSTGRTLSSGLNAISAGLTGDDVDLDSLDAETREWVEKGLGRNEEWADGNGSSFGPVIPNTGATGDDRGWTPQGMDYDDTSRTYFQSYYTPDHTSAIAVIDPVTGKEVTEVQLGGFYKDEAGRNVAAESPSHAGGTSIDGDKVYVTDKGKVYTYSASAIAAAKPGQAVPQLGPPQEVKGGSYSAVHDGRLYLGDFENNQMYVYERDSSGRWAQVGDPVETPDNAQGVAVRDGEYVFSTSYGRHGESALVVQDRETGDRSDEYPLPNMSQSVVEVDGNLVTTYESGAGKFADPGTGGWGWFWGVPDADSLWANPFMTVTPLSELGLTKDVEVEPGSLDQAAGRLDGPVSQVGTAASRLGGLELDPGALGDVPAGPTFLRTCSTAIDGISASLTTGKQALRTAVETLEQSAAAYRAADDGVRQRFGGTTA